MSTVIYDGNRIIPAPFVSIVKTYQKSGNGDIIGKTYSLTITGTIVSHMGSPDSAGAFWTASGYPDNESIVADEKLPAIQRKQEALRELFSEEGKSFEIQSAGKQPVICYPRVVGIEFAEGVWVERCDYTISIECDELYPKQEDVFTEYISDATEEWIIDTNDEPELLNGSTTYALSHTVSAVGKKFYDETGGQPKYPWEYAQDFVLGRLGFDSQMATASGVHNLPSYYNGWNHVRSEQVDKQGGGFSVTENWVLASGSAIEDFTISETNALDNPYVNVAIEGTINGFEERDSDMVITTTKWDNADTKFSEASGLAFLRAQTYSGKSLNIDPLSWTLGKNPARGTINYNFEYDSRPMTLISGVVSEVISVNDNVGGDLFASIFVLGRTSGPVLQDLNTRAANTRGLNIEIVVAPPTYTDRTTVTIKDVLISKKPSNDPTFSGSLQNLIDAVNPSNNGFSTVFQDQPQETWDFKNGNYGYSVVWTYE